MKYKVGDMLRYKSGSYRISILEKNGDTYGIEVHLPHYVGQKLKWAEQTLDKHFRLISKLEKAMK